MDEVLNLMPADRQLKRGRRRLVPEPGKMPERNRGNQSTVPPGEDNRPKLRITLGKRWSQIVQDVKDGEYTWEELAADLDPEELAKGQLKDRDGGWKGRPPAFVPREFHLQCQRELLRRFNDEMKGRFLDATTEYLNLSKIVEPKLREQMLRYIMERVAGPIPKTVEVSGAPKHEGFLAAVVRPGGSVGRASRYDRRTEDLTDDTEEEDG